MYIEYVEPGGAFEYIPHFLCSFTDEDMREISKGRKSSVFWWKVCYKDFSGGKTEIGGCVAYEFPLNVDGKILRPGGFFNPTDPNIGSYRFRRYTLSAGDEDGNKQPNE